MDVAAFVLSILALLFALLGLGLSMRALYIIGVNSGLAKPQENKEKTTIQTPKKFTPKNLYVLKVKKLFITKILWFM